MDVDVCYSMLTVFCFPIVDSKVLLSYLVSAFFLFFSIFCVLLIHQLILNRHYGMKFLNLNSLNIYYFTTCVCEFDSVSCIFIMIMVDTITTKLKLPTISNIYFSCYSLGNNKVISDFFQHPATCASNIGLFTFFLHHSFLNLLSSSHCLSDPSCLLVSYFLSPLNTLFYTLFLFPSSVLAHTTVKSIFYLI